MLAMGWMSAGIGPFFGYLAAGLATLVIFTWIYVWITPYDEVAEINEGKLASSIALAGAMLGFTFPLVVASHVQTSFIEFVGWSVLACVVQVAVFWTLHWLLPRVIATNNAAGALCFAAASVCAGLINAASFIP
jgi:putative membrane protein